MDRPVIDSAGRADVCAALNGYDTEGGAVAAGAMPAGIEHRVFASFEQAAPLRAAWDDLAARHGDLFASFDWCRVWWEHYGASRQLQLHVVLEQSQLIGVLPLFAETLRPLGVPLRVVRLVGCDHALTPAGMAVRPDRAGAVARCVVDWLERHERWDLLHLGPLQYYMEVTRAMGEAFAASGVVDAVLVGERHSCVTVYDVPATYEEYLAGLAGSERRNVLRCERNAIADLGIQAAVPVSPDDVRRAMGSLVQLHQGLWTGKGKLGQFKDWPDYERFHRNMAECLHKSGRLALVTLKEGERIVGVEYGYHFGGRTHALIRGYCDEPRWRNYSIGRMLHCQMLRQAVLRESAMMDDGRGAFEYKRRLGGQIRFERALTVVRRGRGTRLRAWLALRTAWLVHAVYDRMWFDWLRPHLHLPARPLRRSYIRVSFLAQMFKRGHLPLRSGQCWYTLYGENEATCPRMEGTLAHHAASGRGAKGGDNGSVH